jgi:hypothetical protein
MKHLFQSALSFNTLCLRALRVKFLFAFVLFPCNCTWLTWTGLVKEDAVESALQCSHNLDYVPDLAGTDL